MSRWASTMFAWWTRRSWMIEASISESSWAASSASVCFGEEIGADRTPRMAAMPISRTGASSIHLPPS